MVDSRIRRFTVFLAFLLLFGIALGFCLYQETRTCMGVTILTEKEQSQIEEYIFLDVSWELLHNGRLAAVDVETSTIYISQDIRPGTRVQDLRGTLKSSNPGYTLSFVPDAAFSDLASAVKEGHAFKLNVLDNLRRCMQYRVVFTTLPVLRMEGGVIGLDEDGRDLLEGDFCLWSPLDPDTGRYSVKNSTAQWHIRGNTAALMMKQPWKLSLKDKRGENQNLALLGLGADDDWILNSLVMDDTKLREKVFMDLWNTWADQNPRNYKMSSGEYVEVIQNQTYSGLYLLQRRIDKKYCALTEEDILLKGGNILTPANPAEAYRIVFSPFGEEETLGLMEGILTGADVSMILPDNFLDVNLFLQYGSAIDNVGFKNVFYVLKREDDSYRLSMIPWDTDMSWGITFINGFAYDYQQCMDNLVQRREYAPMLQKYPELGTLMSIRWAQLRESIFSEDTVREIFAENQTVLDRSGALKRDQNRWGQKYGGQDTPENLARFLRERLNRLDAYYLS